MALFYSPDTTDDLGVYGQICEPNSAYLPGQLTNYGCSFPDNKAMPSTAALAGVYANEVTGNAAFLAGFSAAYPRMTSVGYGVPANVDGATATGRLGTLTAIDLTTCVPPAPTAQPVTATPTAVPTKTPTRVPTAVPYTSSPTKVPTKTPTATPTKTPTRAPTKSPATGK